MIIRSTFDAGQRIAPMTRRTGIHTAATAPVIRPAALAGAIGKAMDAGPLPALHLLGAITIVQTAAQIVHATPVVRPDGTIRAITPAVLVHRTVHAGSILAPVSPLAMFVAIAFQLASDPRLFRHTPAVVQAPTPIAAIVIRAATLGTQGRIENT